MISQSVHALMVLAAPPGSPWKFNVSASPSLLNAPKESNLVISPLSVSVALGMIYNGAGGTTKTAMARTLAVSAFSDGDVNAGNRELLETLRKADPAVELEIANALWLRAGFGIKPDFIKWSHDFYVCSRRNPKSLVADATLSTGVEAGAASARGAAPTQQSVTHPSSAILQAYFKDGVLRGQKKACRLFRFQAASGRELFRL